MARKFEDILSECLDRVLVGEGIEECLASYQEQADELEPLLRVGLVASRASSVEPSAEFKAAALRRLEAALKHREEQRQKRSLVFFGWLGWQRRLAGAVATLLLLLVLGSGMVWASDGSLPGDPLYRVKLATEQVRLTFAFSSMSKARLHVTLAEERVNEMVQLAERDKVGRMEELVQRLASHLEKVGGLAPLPIPVPVLAPAPAPARVGLEDESQPKLVTAPGVPGTAPGRDIEELRALLEASAQRNLSLLEGILEKAPPQAKPALGSSLERLRQHYEKAIHLLEQGR